MFFAYLLGLLSGLCIGGALGYRLGMKHRAELEKFVRDLKEQIRQLEAMKGIRWHNRS